MMDGMKIFLLLLGMMLVTYLPRLLPLFLVDKMKVGGMVEKFLKLIPYTAMSALIFPGIFTVDSNTLVGIVGGSVAALLAFLKCPVMVCVLAAIAADFLVYLII